SDYALELIYTEFVVREQLGQQPSPEAFCAQYPQWGNRLARLIRVGELLRDHGSVPTQAPPDTVDMQVDDADRWQDTYDLIEILGVGGMGVVYKAWQRPLKRFVALKMMKVGDFASDTERERFQREAEDMARLRHPNIVLVHAVGQRAGLPYIAMELLEGG